jgi:hypothetical protein
MPDTFASSPPNFIRDNQVMRGRSLTLQIAAAVSAA